MLQLLLLQPKLAILDETDSGLDVDALGVVSRGMELYRASCDGTLVIITHNTRILEHLDVDRVHVMVNGRMVHEGDASLIDWIDEHGFERFEQEAASDSSDALPADLSAVIRRPAMAKNAPRSRTSTAPSTTSLTSEEGFERLDAASRRISCARSPSARTSPSGCSTSA